MFRSHHRLNGHEFEKTLENSKGQRSLACRSPWGPKESDMTHRDALLTQCNQIPVVFQHHISVEVLLSRVQLVPLFSGEVHSHVLECQ